MSKSNLEEMLDLIEELENSTQEYYRNGDGQMKKKDLLKICYVAKHLLEESELQ